MRGVIVVIVLLVLVSTAGTISDARENRQTSVLEIWTRTDQVDVQPGEEVTASFNVRYSGERFARQVQVYPSSPAGWETLRRSSEKGRWRESCFFGCEPHYDMHIDSGEIVRVSFTYEVPTYADGQYTIEAKAEDSQNNLNRASVPVRVKPENQPPSADFDVVPSDPVASEAVTLDGTGSTDETGEITSYVWKITGGGSTTRAGSDIQHVFSKPETYSVELTVTDDRGLNDTTQETVQVSENEPPNPKFVHSTSPREKRPIEFDASESTDPDRSITEYQWDFDQDGQFEKSGVRTNHTFQSHGNHTVTLKVVDELGKASVLRKDVYVAQNEPPVAEIEYRPETPREKDVLTFDGTRSHDPDGEIDSFDWDIDGDGFPEKHGRRIRHRFNASGNYTVRLRVTDEYGSTNESEITVPVLPNRPPEVNVSVHPQNPKVFEDVSFDASNSVDPDGRIIEYEWDLDGDGRFESEGIRVEDNFSDEGNYTIGVRISDEKGEETVERFSVSVDCVFFDCLYSSFTNPGIRAFIRSLAKNPLFQAISGIFTVIGCVVTIYGVFFR